jgi:CMP-N-acetylneuraminic acid synthetase
VVASTSEAAAIDASLTQQEKLTLHSSKNLADDDARFDPNVIRAAVLEQCATHYCELLAGR